MLAGAGEHFAKQCGWWLMLVGDEDGLGEQGYRLGEERWLGGVEGRERLTGLDLTAELGMHDQARVRIDRLPGADAPGAQPLDGPADGGGIDAAEMAGSGERER